MSRLYIGTSGFSYKHWESGVFYPKDLNREEQLKFYANHFNSVELNYPFYRLPSKKNFYTWCKKVPKNFLFSVKVSRFITHIKRLKNVENEWENFYKRALVLKEKMGVFLLQFPPSCKIDLESLNKFLQIVQKISPQSYLAFEFRHKSWFCDETYRFFKNQKYKNKITLVLADSSRWPQTAVFKFDFVYIRMHGRNGLYNYKYSDSELKNLAAKIKNSLKETLEVFVYFNNDAHGYAVQNALKLKKEINTNG